MRAGALNKLISIERWIETDNPFGEPVTTWQEQTKAYASINPSRGTEKYISAEKHAEVTHIIEIRYIPNITPKNRIVWSDRIFKILSTIDIGERRKRLKIVAKEEV